MTAAQRTLEYQHRKKAFLDAYKLAQGCGSPWCDLEILGSDDLEFHHNKPEQKSFTIGKDRNRVGWKRLKEEVAKCEVLCFRCHSDYLTTGSQPATL